jgi:hypothetical protein
MAGFGTGCSTLLTTAACKFARWVVFVEFPEECVEGRGRFG